MILVFIGAPGAGKGTQCRRLSKQLKIPHLSTGEILRQLKQDQTPLGIQVAEILDSGQLVEDGLMVEIVQSRIAQSDCENGFLLDGFPRTLPQAEKLDAMLSQNGQSLDCVIELAVPDMVSIRRLSGRFRQSKTQRPEDRPETIPERIKIYNTQTAPLLSHYAERKILHSIDGMESPHKVFNNILDLIG